MYNSRNDPLRNHHRRRGGGGGRRGGALEEKVRRQRRRRFEYKEHRRDAGTREVGWEKDRPERLLCARVAERQSATAPTFVWKGAKKAAAMSIGLGLFVCFVIPRPDGVVPQAWNLLSIFLSYVAGFLVSVGRSVGVSRFDNRRGDEDVDLRASVWRDDERCHLAYRSGIFLCRGFVSTWFEADRVATMFCRETSGKARSDCPTV